MIKFTLLFLVIWKVSIAGFATFIFSIFLHHWGSGFQFPLLRYPKKQPSFMYTIPSGMTVLIFYLLTGYFILFGLSVPLVPTSSISINSFELAVAGILMVAVIRFLTLSTSLDNFHTLLSALVLTFAFIAFLTFEHPTSVIHAINTATTNPTTGNKDLTLVLFLPIVSIIALLTTEGSWYLWTQYKKPLTASLDFVQSIQSSVSTEEIGYSRKNIHQAYLRVLKEVAAEEGIWEICWLSSMGASVDYYDQLIDAIAARIGAEQKITTGYGEYILLQEDEKNFLRIKAKGHIKKHCMFLIHASEKEGEDLFEERLGFPAGSFKGDQPA